MWPPNKLNNEKELVYCKYYGDDKLKQATKIVQHKCEEAVVIIEEAKVMALINELIKSKSFSLDSASEFLATKAIKYSPEQIKSIIETITLKNEHKILKKPQLLLHNQFFPQYSALYCRHSF